MPSADDFPLKAAVLMVLQSRGDAPPPGQISIEDLADGLGLSCRRIRDLEMTALAKIRLALSNEPACLAYLARLPDAARLAEAANPENGKLKTENPCTDPCSPLPPHSSPPASL